MYRTWRQTCWMFSAQTVDVQDVTSDVPNVFCADSRCTGRDVRLLNVFCADSRCTGRDVRRAECFLRRQYMYRTWRKMPIIPVCDWSQSFSCLERRFGFWNAGTLHYDASCVWNVRGAEVQGVPTVAHLVVCLVWLCVVAWVVPDVSKSHSAFLSPATKSLRLVEKSRTARWHNRTFTSTNPSIPPWVYPENSYPVSAFPLLSTTPSAVSPFLKRFPCIRSHPSSEDIPRLMLRAACRRPAWTRFRARAGDWRFCVLRDSDLLVAKRRQWECAVCFYWRTVP